MNNFRNIKENTSLSPEKKQEMWASITAKIGIFETSLPENVRMGKDIRHMEWGASIMPSVLSPKKKYMNNVKIFATMILILWSIVGTASYAAESALPGDALYGFKVNVNESVRGAFSFSAEDKANWEIEKIERRAHEKAQLVASAKITAEADAEIESRSQDSAEKVQEIIVRLQAEWKAEAATSLEGGLNTALNAMHNGVTYTNNNAHGDAQSETDMDVKVPINVKLKTQGTNNTNTNTSSHTSSESEADVDAEVDVDLDVDGSVHSDSDNDSSSGSHSSSSDTDLDLDAALDSALDVDAQSSSSSSNSGSSHNSNNSSNGSVNTTVDTAVDTASNLHF